MKKFNIVSPVYKGKVNFDGVILDFDATGNAVLEFNEKDEPKIQIILETYPNIFKDKLPENLGKESIIKKEEVSTNSAELEILKQGNIEFAKENVALKKENEELKKENAILKVEIETLKSSKKETSINSEEEFINEDIKEVKKEEVNIEASLNKKTVTELKGILHDVYGEFEEEWKSLNKKDDIIKYIIAKSAE